MNVRFAIPRRSDDGGWRDRVWEFCRAYWHRELPDWPLEEGHHDQGPFNRSAAINRAAQGDWDVLVIIDGDVVCDADRVKRAAEAAHEYGRLVLPYDKRHLLNRRGSRLIVQDRHDGAWDRFIAATEGRRHYSSIVCVPRALWDEVDGFDERFEGWGGEDDAFHTACAVLTGGFDRLKGPVWHLWHPKSPHRSIHDPLYKQAWGLVNRYWSAKTPAAMRALLAEDRGPDQVVVVCLTNGARPDELARTLASAEEMLEGPIGRRIIANDSGRQLDFDGWEDVRIGRRSGYTKATKSALELAYGSGQPWVFFLEDDFIFNEPIDLRAMQAVMASEPNLVQLSLKRQAWYDCELEAGGIIEAKPEAFEQRQGFVAHRDYWAQNPMLCRRQFLAENEWPLRSGSERAFANHIFRANPNHIAGIYGCIEDPPRCTHIGAERAGVGY